MAGVQRFPPSVSKLRRARRDGDVAKSRYLTAVGVLLTALASLVFLPLAVELIADFVVVVFSVPFEVSSEEVVGLLKRMGAIFFAILVPFLFCTTLAVLVVEAAQVGVHFTPKSISFSLGRLNPFSGLKRLLGLSSPNSSWGIFSVGKTFVYFLLMSAGGSVVLLGVSSLEASLLESAEWQDLLVAFMQRVFLLIVVCFPLALVVGVADVALVRVQRRQRLSMSLDELRREQREETGSPELKAMRLQLRREIESQSLLNAVRRAKLVVVD